MEFFRNIGISYTGDYIIQGSNIDKVEKSEKMSAKYTELYIRKDGKEFDIEALTKLYHGELLFHLPTLKSDLSNLKSVTDNVIKLVKYGIKTVIIDASMIPLDVFEWSTFEEQQDYIKTVSNGLSQIISNGVNLLIENPSDKGNVSYLGRRVENISDLIMYTKNNLIKNYDYSRDKADSSIGVSFNITNLYGDINEYSKWFNVLANNIKVVKVTDVDNAISIFDGILTKMLVNKFDPIILIQSDMAIEEINNKYRKFEYLIDCKRNNRNLTLDNYTDIKVKDNEEYDFSASNQSGYSSIVIICMIVTTVLIAAIMLYFKFRN